MNKNKYMKSVFIVMVALFCLSACQQNEWANEIETEDHNCLISRGVSCEVTVNNPGELDAALTAKAQAGDFKKEDLETITIIGPVSIDDIISIKNFEHIQTLDLTNATFMLPSGDSYIAVEYVPGQAFKRFKSPAEVLLPKAITGIGAGAFEESKIISICIPETVTYIQELAFWNCENLTQVNIPAQLTEIKQNTFKGCAALTTVEMPDNIIKIGGCAFEKSGLIRITIPESVTEIGGYAFAACEELETVDWPSNIHELPDGIFEACSKLQFDIPSHITKIGSRALYGTAITEAIIPDGVEMDVLNDCFSMCKNLQEIQIPNQIRMIEDWALAECTALESIVLPTSLTDIGMRAFDGCSNLSQIEFNDNLKTIGKECFFNCTSLQIVTLPEGLTTIGDGAFSCTGITMLTVPSTVTSCGNNIAESEGLSVVVWDSTLDVPNFKIRKWDYEKKEWYFCNPLIFAPENATSAPENQNVVYGNHASSIDLNSLPSFYCPRSFTTDAITYTVKFPESDSASRSDSGDTGGWSTITLPFVPTAITQKSDGKTLAPFNSDKEAACPFWLRELTTEGFVDVTAVEAYKPYIIAMPNNSRYKAEYIVTGDVVFKAEGNVIIPATPELTPVAGPDFSFTSAYDVVPKSASVWTLNNNIYNTGSESYLPGSVFIADQRDVQPFEAYVIDNTTRGILPVVTQRASTRSAHVVGPIPSIYDM